MLSREKFASPWVGTVQKGATNYQIYTKRVKFEGRNVLQTSIMDFKNNTLFKYNTYNCSIMIVFNLFFLFFTIVMTESVRFSFGGGGSSVLSVTTLSVLMLNGLSSQLGSSVWVAVVWIKFVYHFLDANSYPFKWLWWTKKSKLKKWAPLLHPPYPN